MHPLFWVSADSHGDKRLLRPPPLQSIRVRRWENSTRFSTTRMHPGWEFVEGRKEACQLHRLQSPEHKARSRIYKGPVGLRLTDAHSPGIL